MTDEAIVRLVTNTDSREEGFRQLVGKYQRRLYHTIRYRVSSHEDADDVMQNTFLKVFKYFERFEGRSSLYTWMYRIAMNEVSNHHKRNHRIPVEKLENAEIQRAEVYVDIEDLDRKMEEAIARLPERQQMVFRMRYYDELTYREMASLLELSEGALKASFHHAVKKIESHLTANQIL